MSTVPMQKLCENKDILFWYHPMSLARFFMRKEPLAGVGGVLGNRVATRNGSRLGMEFPVTSLYVLLIRTATFRWT